MEHTPPLSLVTTPPAVQPPAVPSCTCDTSELHRKLDDIATMLGSVAAVVADSGDDMRFVLDVLRAAGSIAKPIRKAIDEAEARRGR